MKKTKRRPIHTAIIVDFMGHGYGEVTREEEIASYVKRFTRLLGPLKVETPMYVSDTLDAELVIYDFGGLMPGSDLMESNARALVRWALDHSNALVVVVSQFTFTHYVKFEAEDMGLTVPPNIIVDETTSEEIDNDVDSADSIPEWFKKGL